MPWHVIMDGVTLRVEYIANLVGVGNLSVTLTTFNWNLYWIIFFISVVIKKYLGYNTWFSSCGPVKYLDRFNTQCIQHHIATLYTNGIGQINYHGRSFSDSGLIRGSYIRVVSGARGGWIPLCLKIVPQILWLLGTSTIHFSGCKYHLCQKSPYQYDPYNTLATA